jgi:hypothetical protein
MISPSAAPWRIAKQREGLCPPRDDPRGAPAAQKSARVNFLSLCCGAAQTVGDLLSKAAEISSDQILSRASFTT